MAWFTLHRIDSATMCFTHDVHFETDDVAQIKAIASCRDLKPGEGAKLSATDYSKLVSTFKLEMPLVAERGEIIWRVSDTFDRRPTHTGRELLLMLAGKKPFAAFVDTVPPTAPDVIPEPLFAPYVAAGRFVKREALEYSIGPNGKMIHVRRVMYAVPNQVWRFDAFLSLWEQAKKHGWNDDFEKLEGFLYGYDTDIDSIAAPKGKDTP
jgi:hypothetical protein